MLSFRNRRAAGWSAFVSFLSILSLSILLSTGPALADKNKVKNAKRKKNLTSASPNGSPGEQSLTNIPLPVGHEAKGLVLPDFNNEGRLVGRFEAGIARRIDEGHMGFEDLKITTFTEENQVDLRVNMHTSIFDLNTRILTSKERTTVQRADFNIVGDAAEFDTNSRNGRLIGNVKMVINGQSNLTKRAGQP